MISKNKNQLLPVVKRNKKTIKDLYINIFCMNISEVELNVKYKTPKEYLLLLNKKNYSNKKKINKKEEI